MYQLWRRKDEDDMGLPLKKVTSTYIVIYWIRMIYSYRLLSTLKNTGELSAIGMCVGGRGSWVGSVV